ncbi:PREDICTED: coiled-coil domain-containing protein 114 [Myotis brandtii]|uniref:coiled-coil domain-containing protein 114 n=1 Tax=Myotis brandtii TaxID=109478 RepID=UPI0007040552|nr:PREDICTED: coiled-coil domain-containing protein 114 [Myotis brandtii]
MDRLGVPAGRSQSLAKLTTMSTRSEEGSEAFQETLVDWELSRLQRQYKVMEVERRAYSKEVHQRINKQLEEIQRLQDVQNKLQVKIGIAQSQVKRLRDNERMENMSHLLKCRAQVEAEVKELQEQTRALDRQIQEWEARLSACGKDPRAPGVVLDQKAKTRKRIKIVENQLDRVTCHFDIHLVRNAALREELDLLLVQRNHYLNIDRKLHKEMQLLRRTINGLTVSSISAYSVREEAKTKMSLLRERADKEGAQNETDVQILQRQIAHLDHLHRFLQFKNHDRQPDPVVLEKREKRARTGNLDARSIHCAKPVGLFRCPFVSVAFLWVCLPPASPSPLPSPPCSWAWALLSESSPSPCVSPCARCGLSPAATVFSPSLLCVRVSLGLSGSFRLLLGVPVLCVSLRLCPPAWPLRRGSQHLPPRPVRLPPLLVWSLPRVPDSVSWPRLPRSAEERNFAEFNFINEQNSELERLREEIKEMKEAMKKARYGDAARLSLKEENEASVQQQIGEVRAEADSLEARAQTLREQVEKFKAGLRGAGDRALGPGLTSGSSLQSYTTSSLSVAALTVLGKNAEDLPKKVAPPQLPDNLEEPPGFEAKEDYPLSKERELAREQHLKELMEMAKKMDSGQPLNLSATQRASSVTPLVISQSPSVGPGSVLSHRTNGILVSGRATSANSSSSYLGSTGYLESSGGSESFGGLPSKGTGSESSPGPASSTGPGSMESKES